MIPCICINDSQRPKEIPESKWIKEGGDYHITFVAFCLPQKISGVSIYEKPLDESCNPYEYFAIKRFAFTKENLELLIELAKDCTKLDEILVEQLMEEAHLETI